MKSIIDNRANMKDANIQRLRIRVTGLVQGVWFRKYTRESALQRGLTGWVANASDGSVLIEAEGPTDALEDFLAWCRRGSPMARVEDVQWTHTGIMGDKAFEIRR